VSTGRSIGILTILNLAGAVLAVVNSVIIAWFFGTSRALEVFFAASTLELLISGLTQSGQLAEILVPIYHQVRFRHGLEKAQAVFAMVVNWTMFLVAAMSAALWFLAPLMVWMLVPGFSPADRALGTSMFRWLIPLLGAQVLFALFRRLGFAERQFGAPEATGVAGRLAVLGGTIALAPWLGIWALVVALWAGQIVQLGGCLWVLRRMDYRHHFILRDSTLRMRDLWKQLSYSFVYVGTTQVYAYVLNAAVSLLPQGTYAAFKCVQQLYSKTGNILLSPISVVYFTHASQAAAEGASSARALARTALARGLGISALAVAAISLTAHPLLAGLWGANRFGGEHLYFAATLLVVSFALLPADSLGLIARKTAMSLGLVKHQYLAAALVQLVCALGAWQLIALWDRAGLMAVVALNSVGLATASMAVLWIWRRELAVFFPLDTLWRWGLSALCGLALAAGLRLVLGAWFPLHGRLLQLAWAALLGGASLAGCLLAAWSLRVPDVQEAQRRLFVKLGVGQGRKVKREESVL